MCNKVLVVLLYRRETRDLSIALEQCCCSLPVDEQGSDVRYAIAELVILTTHLSSMGYPSALSTLRIWLIWKFWLLMISIMRTSRLQLGSFSSIMSSQERAPEWSKDLAMLTAFW